MLLKYILQNTNKIHCFVCLKYKYSMIAWYDCIIGVYKLAFTVIVVQDFFV